MKRHGHLMAAIAEPANLRLAFWKAAKSKRDLEPERWGPADYPETVNHDDLGDLGLSDQQLADLVALMDAFTDRSLLKEEVKTGKAFPQAPPGVSGTDEMRLHFPDWTHRLDPVFRRRADPVAAEK